VNVDSIRAYCLAFPRATEKLQWGDDLCFKVAGKIFTMLGLDNPRLCFKCSPEVFAELIEREDIRPAPYVGRYKWVMLDRLDAVSDSELEGLIQQSYNMVAAKAPKRSKLRPRKSAKSKAPRKQKSRKTPLRAKRRKRRKHSNKNRFP
jgi:predicted DNA-binding protein (MmcQ/YjbR family)